MEITRAYVLFVVAFACACVPEVLGDCHASDACPCTPDTGNGGRYPSHPLKWREFESLFVDGQSLEYLEVYSLAPRPELPVLTKVIYRWIKTEESRYFNPVSGWYGDFQFCYNNTIEYSRSHELRFGDRVRFDFNYLIPGPIPFTGTLFSSCPDRYLINWYCPTEEISDNYCMNGLRMSISARDGPENLPWHLVTKDLCRNKAPFLDDKRWHFTYSGPQCELDLGNQARKKREVSSPEQRMLWP